MTEPSLDDPALFRSALGKVQHAIVLCTFCMGLIDVDPKRSAPEQLWWLLCTREGFARHLLLRHITDGAFVAAALHAVERYRESGATNEEAITTALVYLAGQTHGFRRGFADARRQRTDA